MTVTILFLILIFVLLLISLRSQPEFIARLRSGLRFPKNKTPLPVGQWGSRNFCDKSEPHRHAGKRAKQQVQIQITIHAGSLAVTAAGVNSFP
jgi:hypothetical protein